MNQTLITDYKFILTDENEIPFIEGTSMKVVELVTSIHAYGWSPEELHFQYPHISMSQIYSALAATSLIILFTEGYQNSPSVIHVERN